MLPQRFLLPATLSCLLLLPLPSRAQSPPPLLAPTAPQSGTIQSDRGTTLRLEVADNQLVKLRVEQEGIDLVVKVFDAAGNLVIAADRQYAGQPEQITMLVENGGQYRLELVPFEPGTTGNFTASVVEQRPLTQRDRDLQEAEELLAGAGQAPLETAIANLTTATELFQAADAGLGVIRAQRALGDRYAAVGDSEAALRAYQVAYDTARDLGMALEAAVLQVDIANVYTTLRQRQPALDNYQAALATMRELGDRVAVADVLRNLGSAYLQLGEPDTALSPLAEALAIQRQLDPSPSRAATLNLLGEAHLAQGEPAAALTYFTEASDLYQTLNRPTLAANLLNNVARAQRALGDLDAAVIAYEQGLALFAAQGDRSSQATLLNNLGLAYSDFGDRQAALAAFQRSLAILQDLGARRRQAITLGNIGTLYNELGDKQQALDAYAESLALSEAVGDRDSIATLFNNLGKLYEDLGDFEQAEIYYQRSLPLLQELGDRRREARTLNNLGALAGSLGDFDQAREYYETALPQLQAVGDRSGAGSTLGNIGSTYLNAGDWPAAIAAYEQALALQIAVGDRPTEAISRLQLSIAHREQGDFARASELLEQAIALYQQVSNPEGEAQARFQRALLARARQDLPAARADLRAAIAIVEDVRTSLVNANLRTSYFATVQDYYDVYIDVLMELHWQDPERGYDAEALHASERAKARSLIELLAEADADIRQDVDPELLQREQALQAEFEQVEARRLELLAAAAESSALAALDAQRQALLRAFEQVEADIRATSPRYAALTQPQPLTLAEIQDRVLDEDTILLAYKLGRDRSYLWVATTTGLTSYELPPQAEIEPAVRRFRRRAIQRRSSLEQIEREARSLSELVLAPAAAQLDGRRLLVAADGVLHYLPFAALQAPQAEDAGYQPLLLAQATVNVPSASALAVLRAEAETASVQRGKVAIFADPVFSADDERVTQQQPTDDSALPLLAQQLDRAARSAGLDWERLPGTRREAQIIRAIAPEATSFFDFQANKATATSAELVQYDIIHLATHGFVNGTTPELSGLVLSLVDPQGERQNGFLRLSEIYNLKLNAALVVLSACQTGQGELVRGEGLIGLTRGFMYAGAPRLVTSLWSVNDAGTALLMSEFYRQMLVEAQAPAAALRAAQLHLWEQEEWRSPYYWSAFTLQGEWR